MPDLRPNSAYSSQPGVSLVHTVHGDPVEQTTRPNNTDDGVTQAVGSLYRPYVAPPRVVEKGRCTHDGCRGWATKTGYCAGHSRSMGLITTWSDRHESD